MFEQLKEQIGVVAKARQKAVELKSRRDTLLEEWNKANQVLFDALTQAGAEVAEVEAKLRELTLQTFALTGNKQPALGVGIREVTKLEYDPQEALTWAIKYKMALKLDVPVFEKRAKASPPPFVKITQEPQATIAVNLANLDIKGF